MAVKFNQFYSVPENGTEDTELQAFRTLMERSDLMGAETISDAVQGIANLRAAGYPRELSDRILKITISAEFVK